jgi:hypothetical protein
MVVGRAAAWTDHGTDCTARPRPAIQLEHSIERHVISPLTFLVGKRTLFPGRKGAGQWTTE